MDWRLILDGAQDGARNMAVDEALLQLHARDQNSAPALRFYSWNPACLSLGRFQKCEDVPSLSREYSRDASRPAFSWIRRPTGGRAVWHQHEITYCVVLRAELLPPDAQSVVGAYEWLSRAFLGGLFALGVNAELASLAPRESASTRDEAVRASNCFEKATRSDFVADGRKIIGAAQMRRQGVALQHGSILLSIDQAAWRAAGGAMNNAVALRDLGVTASREEIIQALCDSFQKALSARLHETQLSEEEEALASTREVEKYLTSAWNEGGSEAFSSGENGA